MSHLRRVATSAIHAQKGPARQLRRLAVGASDAAVDCMKRDGAVIVEGLVTKESVTRSLEDISDALRLGYLEHKPGDFFEERTSRATGLIGKSRTYVHDQLMHPTLRTVSKYFLTTKHLADDPSTIEYSWETPPQVSSCVAFQIDSGAKSQVLHRDDTIYNYKHTSIASWDELRDRHREATLSMFVAGTISTAQNGATRLIPGSHLWDDLEEPKEEDAVHAELEPGDALLMLSSVYHGGSANTTADEKRVVFASSIARGILRQEENQYLVTPLEVMKEYPLDLQRFVGFQQEFPELGWTRISEKRQ